MKYNDLLELADQERASRIVANSLFAEHLSKSVRQENIQNHKKANELLFNLPSTFETHNEFHINWQVIESIILNVNLYQIEYVLIMLIRR